MTATTTDHEEIRIHRFSGGAFEASPRPAYGVWHQRSGDGCLECPVAGTVKTDAGSLVLHDGALGASGETGSGAEAFEIEFSRALLDDVARVEYGVRAPSRLDGGARLLDDAVLAQMTLSMLRISDDITASAATENASTDEGPRPGSGGTRAMEADPLAGRRARISLGTLAWAVAAHLLGHHLLVRRDTSSHARIGKVFSYVDANLTGPVRLEDMANEAGLSVFYFSRVFARQTGQTPQQYVRARRVRRARRMLLNTRLSLAEIAYSCGFSHQSHFTAVFREQTGRTPGQFRKEAGRRDKRSRGADDEGPVDSRSSGSAGGARKVLAAQH